MIFNEHLPLNHAFPFAEINKRASSNVHYVSDRYEAEAESVNNYLKTIAEIDADMLAAGNNPGVMNSTYTGEMNLNGEMKESNNVIVSPATLYHGFMEENY